MVGFAAETGDAHGDVLEYAAEKLKRKGCDLLVVNHVGSDKVFGQDHNSVVILSRAGSEPQSASGTKHDVAAVVIDRIGAELSQGLPANLTGVSNVSLAWGHTPPPVRLPTSKVVE